MVKILCVEDEAAISDTITYALDTEGFQTKWVPLGQQGLQEIKNNQSYALMILDVGLPDINGFEVCKQVRQFSEIPIIFLTARNEEIDRIVGLEIGADDYISKPFSPRELAARVKAILKRSHNTSSQKETDFIIDKKRALIKYCDQDLELTRYEYLILKLLLQQPEWVFSREQIMDHVWSEPETSLDRVVDTHVKSLRTKLRQINNKSEPIKTHRGLGYSLSGSVRES